MHEWDGVCFACLRCTVEEKKTLCPLFKEAEGEVMGVEITASTRGGGGAAQQEREGRRRSSGKLCVVFPGADTTCTCQ